MSNKMSPKCRRRLAKPVDYYGVYGPRMPIGVLYGPGRPHAIYYFRLHDPCYTGDTGWILSKRAFRALRRQGWGLRVSQVVFPGDSIEMPRVVGPDRERERERAKAALSNAAAARRRLGPVAQLG